MNTSEKVFNRRSFIRHASVLPLIGLPFTGHTNTTTGEAEKSLYVVGPMEGYSPQIGTLVSMLNYNRHTIIEMVKSMTMEQIDYLHDTKSNTIAALIMHLGAVEKFYQGNTFKGLQDLSAEDKKIWGPAMELGDDGRKNIRGKEVSYYLDLIGEIRQKTLELFKSKDDAWLLAIDPVWSKEEKMDLNCYWKWFHVCEHESNHRGQMAWLSSRVPGGKATKE